MNSAILLALGTYFVIGIGLSLVVAGNMHEKSKPTKYIIVVALATIPLWLPGLLFVIGGISAEHEQKRQELENKFKGMFKND